VSPTLNLPFQLHRPAPPAAQAAALLNALDEGGVNDDAMVKLTLQTPALLITLLWMSPLKPEERSLDEAIAIRLSHAGATLIRAWILQANTPHHDDEFVRHGSVRSVHFSRLTSALGVMLCAHDVPGAQLAGFWLGAGELCLAASVQGYARMFDASTSPDVRLEMEQEQLGTDHLQLASQLAADCGLGLEIQDAILMSRLGAARLEGAHPLACMLHVATSLVEEAPDLERIAHFSSLPSTTLEALRDAYLKGISDDLDHTSASEYPGVPAPWRTTVFAALSRELFGSLTDDVRAILARSFRMLFGSSAPLLLREEGGFLVPFATGHDAEAQAMVKRVTELRLGMDDASSVVALAVRSQAITTQYTGRDTPTRSAKDWHLARWLGSRSLTCLPFEFDEQRGVGIIGVHDDPAGITAEHRLMAQLVIQAARSHFQDALFRHQITAHGDQIRDELMAHVRRIKHEASGPLTVLQTQLSLISDHDEDTDAPVSLADIGREVARVNTLLAELTAPPAPVSTEAGASINAEVGRLEELYGRALFDQRGRHLEVRLPPHLPAVAMPPQVLTQILLNLVRNASEALQEGGTLSIRSSGIAITGGRPCVELVLKDDGPGLPPARQKALFEPADSTKGEDHQGVGLSIVKQLLDDHGAYIFCRTIKNQGTSFQIYIPVVDC